MRMENVDQSLSKYACLQSGLFKLHNESFVSLDEMWGGSVGMSFLLLPAVASQLPCAVQVFILRAGLAEVH